MRALTGRERFFVGVFVVALIWGGWNYRHLFRSDTPPAAESIQPARPSAPAAQQQPVAANSAPALHAELPAVPAWGPDPFQRPWRHTSSVAPAP